MGLQASCSEDELLDDSLGFHDLLYRLFHEEGVRVFEPRPLTDACRCSREQLENVLKAMPRAEIEDLKRNGAVEVTCEFCTRLYRSEAHTSELQSLMRISYAVFCLNKQTIVLLEDKWRFKKKIMLEPKCNRRNNHN